MMQVGNMMGTYDASGNFRAQCVHLGVLQYSKRPGLFTGGYLAMPLTQEQYDEIAAMDWEAAVKYVANRFHFQLVER